MHSILQNETEIISEKTENKAAREPAAADELAVTLELLAAVGLTAEVDFDGDAELCPHCLSQALSEAA